MCGDKTEKWVEAKKIAHTFKKGDKILWREVAEIQGCDVLGLLLYCS